MNFWKLFLAISVPSAAVSSNVLVEWEASKSRVVTGKLNSDGVIH